jgi:hypothetical protein
MMTLLLGGGSALTTTSNDFVTFNKDFGADVKTFDLAYWDVADR